MKAALLSALSFQPELVVLDEPFSGLDPLVRDELVDALLAAAPEAGRTVFVSSHDVEEVERLADWVGFMADGRLRISEPVESLLRRFRLVEVVASQTSALNLPAEGTWLLQGTSGRTLRFVDTGHDRPDASRRIADAFPGASIYVTPMRLREIFLVLARARVLVEGL
jgi:ABC-2 type transport system ATP-binding protein